MFVIILVEIQLHYLYTIPTYQVSAGYEEQMLASTWEGALEEWQKTVTRIVTKKVMIGKNTKTK